MRKKLLTFLFAIAASIGPIFANGTKIGDLYYVFDDTDQTAWVTWQTLYYSYDYEWDNYRGLSDVAIPSSIEYNNTAYTVVGIGGAAFGTSSIESVTIPSTVTTIDNDAFYDCWNLKSLNIPNSVTSIGAEAFESCSGLTSIDIPNSVTSIGELAFQGCSGLTSPVYNAHIFAYMPTSYSGAYTIPDGIESIVSGAFSYCRSLTSVTIPNSVTSIGDRAFSYCSGLTSPVCNAHIFAYMPEAYSGEYAIPDGIETIAGSAFSLCESLSSVTIPESVTNIGNKAFYGCSSLTSVTIPSNVTSIGEDAFGNCSGLISITCKATTPPSLGYGVFYNVDTSIPLFVPEGCVEAYQTAQYWNKFKNIYTIKINIDKVEIDGLYYNLDPHTLTAEVTSQNAESWDAQITNAEIPSSVSSESITYSVTSIGYRAFYGCSSMLSVTIPSSVTSIGREAFYGCSSLASVIIPNSVTSIGDYAFNDCSGLTSLTIGDFAFKLQNGNWALVKYTGHEQIVQLPDATIFGNTYYIEDSAFPHNEEMTSVIIPNGVTSISVFAFYECVNLTSVTIPNSVTSIGFDQFGQGAFVDCGINEIHFTGTIDEWLAKSWFPRSISHSYSLYVGDAKIEECVLPNSVTSIGDLAFVGCISLTSISIPNTVTSVGEYAFSGCSSLTTILVPCEDIERFRTMLNNDQRVVGSVNIIDYSNLIELLADETKGKIVVDIEPNDCDSIITISPAPNEGFTFLKWGDGNTDNSRTIELTQEKQSIVAIFRSEAINLSYLATGGTDFGEMTTDNPNVWSYNKQYGAYGSKQGGATGNLFTPATDMSMARKITLSFQHAHKFAGTPSEEFTLWVTKDFQGTWDDSEWQQLTISPYSNNTSWAFYNVSIDVPTTCVGTNTVFAFRYKSTQSNYGTWEIKNLKITLEDDGKYEIVDESDQTMGHVAGVGLYDYLTTIELTANPEYGYHFTQWSDGYSDDTRSIVVTKDTAFAAEFAADKSGVCGDNNALTWEYNSEEKLLIISGDGLLNSNYTYGVEAPTQAEKIYIGDGVTSVGECVFSRYTNIKSVELSNSITFIGNSAFEGCENLETLSLGENISHYGDKAFAGCPNIKSIYNYRPRPSKLGAETFKDVDYFECTLYVLAGSVDMYKSSGSDWKDFYFIEPIGAESVTTDELIVTPHDNTTDIVWPAVSDANTYEIEITKDGEVFCRLVFNAQGQLISIAFAPSRANVAQQVQEAGFSFTVTGLTSGTTYGYTVTAVNSESQVLDTKQGTFTTTGGIATAVDDANVDTKPVKVIRSGVLYILRGDKTYTVQGQEVK